MLMSAQRSHFNHAKAQQQSDNFLQHDDAPGPLEGGYIFFFSSSSSSSSSRSNHSVINRYVSYVKHTLIT